MAATKEVDVNVVGLGSSDTKALPETLSYSELKEATGLDGTIRINGESQSLKDHDVVHLHKGDMISKEMPKVSHG